MTRELNFPDQERVDQMKKFVLCLSLLSFGCLSSCPIQIEVDPKPTEEPTPTPTEIPTNSPTITLTPTNSPSPTPTVSTLLSEILVDPPITEDSTSTCSGDRVNPLLVAPFRTAREKVRQNLPQIFYSENCVLDGLEPITQRSYRDIYAYATAYHLRQVNINAIVDYHNRSEVVISNGSYTFSENYSTLEGGFSPFCDGVAIRVRPCPGCFRATCFPSWFKLQ